MRLKSNEKSNQEYWTSIRICRIIRITRIISTHLSTAVTSYGQRGAPPEIFENLSVGLKRWETITKSNKNALFMHFYFYLNAWTDCKVVYIWKFVKSMRSTIRWSNLLKAFCIICWNNALVLFLWYLLIFTHLMKK
jgi:hypothetical protein